MASHYLEGNVTRFSKSLLQNSQKHSVILNLVQNLPDHKHDVECELNFSLKNNKLYVLCCLCFLSFERCWNEL